MSAKAASRPSATESRKRPPAGYNSRQAPGALYTIETVQASNGHYQEVITIADTPEPQSHSGNAVASTSGAHYDHAGAAAEPSAKRRKSDGVHISDNPYAASSLSSSRAKQLPPSYHDGRNGDARNGVASGSGSTSKNKRKHGQDPYDDYSDRGSDRVSPSRLSSSGRGLVADASPSAPQQRPSQKTRPAAASVEDLEIADKEGHYIVRPGTEITGCERRRRCSSRVESLSSAHR